MAGARTRLDALERLTPPRRPEGGVLTDPDALAWAEELAELGTEHSDRGSVLALRLHVRLSPDPTPALLAHLHTLDGPQNGREHAQDSPNDTDDTPTSPTPSETLSGPPALAAPLQVQRPRAPLGLRRGPR